MTSWYFKVSNKEHWRSGDITLYYYIYQVHNINTCFFFLIHNLNVLILKVKSVSSKDTNETVGDNEYDETKSTLKSL